MTSTARQPMLLNHNGNGALEVLKITEEELQEAIDETVETGEVSDIIFSSGLFKLLFSDTLTRPQIGLLVLILEGVYGEKFELKTEVIERLVNAITDNEVRRRILSVMADIDEMQ
jgi:hypothetical protein